jgi:hypothetical protein
MSGNWIRCLPSRITHGSPSTSLHRVATSRSGATESDSVGAKLGWLSLCDADWAAQLLPTGTAASVAFASSIGTAHSLGSRPGEIPRSTHSTASIGCSQPSAESGCLAVGHRFHAVHHRRRERLCHGIHDPVDCCITPGRGGSSLPQILRVTHTAVISKRRRPTVRRPARSERPR